MEQLKRCGGETCTRVGSNDCTVNLLKSIVYCAGGDSWQLMMRRMSKTLAMAPQMINSQWCYSDNDDDDVNKQRAWTCSCQH